MMPIIHPSYYSTDFFKIDRENLGIKNLSLQSWFLLKKEGRKDLKNRLAIAFKPNKLPSEGNRQSLSFEGHKIDFSRAIYVSPH